MPELKRMTSVDEIDPLIAESSDTQVLIFKHSLTCPISIGAFREFERFLDDRPEDDSTLYHLVEIQKSRDVSTAIANSTGVKHESPQALLFRGGEVAWHASHWSIKKESLSEAIGDA